MHQEWVDLQGGSPSLLILHRWGLGFRVQQLQVASCGRWSEDYDFSILGLRKEDPKLWKFQDGRIKEV